MLQFPEKQKAPTPRRASHSKGQSDPVLQIIAEYRQALRDWCDAQSDLDQACFAAKDRTGYIPYSLIPWRHYSAIGASELRTARNDFLRRGLSPAVIEAEYKDAKQRLRAAKKREKDWVAENGIGPVQLRADALLSKLRATEDRLGNAKPRTPAAIAALLRLGLEDSFDSDWDWQRNAVEAAVQALENSAAEKGGF